MTIPTAEFLRWILPNYRFCGQIRKLRWWNKSQISDQSMLDWRSLPPPGACDFLFSMGTYWFHPTWPNRFKMLEVISSVVLWCGHKGTCHILSPLCRHLVTTSRLPATVSYLGSGATCLSDQEACPQTSEYEATECAFERRLQWGYHMIDAVN